MPELFDESELVAFTDAPSLTESETLTDMGRNLFKIDTFILEAEAAVKRAKEFREELTMKKLPDYMRKIRQDSIGLDEFGVDLKLENFYHANIAADWEPEKRKEAFDYLEEIGEGDLVKCVLTIPFPRYMMKVALWLQTVIKSIFYEDDEGEKIPMPESDVEMTVPWNTLTAWMRGQLESGEPVDLDKIGGKVGYVVKIKERKETKKRK